MWPTAKEITRKGRSVKSMCVNGNYVCQTGWVWRLWLSLMPSGVHLCERSHLRTSPALPSKVELSHWICPDNENKSRPLSPYLSPWHPAKEVFTKIFQMIQSSFHPNHADIRVNLFQPV